MSRAPFFVLSDTVDWSKLMEFLHPLANMAVRKHRAPNCGLWAYSLQLFSNSETMAVAIKCCQIQLSELQSKYFQGHFITTLILNI